MKVETEFLLNASPAEAFELVTDIERVAPCFPGAQLKTRVDDDTYKGEIAVALGPIKLSFAGRLQFMSRDRDQQTAQLKARGKEQRGRGAADALVDIVLVADGDATTVRLHTDLNLAGPVAQYGRASGVVEGVAREVVQQFATNLEQHLQDPDSEIQARPVAGLTTVGKAVLGNLRESDSDKKT